MDLILFARTDCPYYLVSDKKIMNEGDEMVMMHSKKMMEIEKLGNRKSQVTQN